MDRTPATDVALAGASGSSAGGGVGSGVTESAVATYSSRFGDPATLEMTSGVAPEMTPEAGCPAPRRRATAPATCGAAMDVPEYAAVDVVEEGTDDVMPTPGAKRSTQLP